MKNPMSEGAKRLNTKLLAEVAAVICIKISCIALIWFMFFSTETRLDQTPENVADGILSRTTSITSSTVGK